jgi:hypothetical protein
MDLNKIARSLSNLSCKVHREKATITTKGKDVSFACCCESFKKDILQEFNKKVEKEIEKELQSIFKK